MLSNYGLMSM